MCSAGFQPIRVKLIHMITKFLEEFFGLVGEISRSYEGDRTTALLRDGELVEFVIAIRRRRDERDL